MCTIKLKRRMDPYDKWLVKQGLLPKSKARYNHAAYLNRWVVAKVKCPTIETFAPCVALVDETARAMRGE